MKLFNYYNVNNYDGNYSFNNKEIYLFNINKDVGCRIKTSTS